MTVGTPAQAPLIRIESGNPDQEELVALTTVLLARTGLAAAEPPGTGPGSLPPAVRWTRPERRAPYRSPTSWQR
ncbi:hypothetical protein AQI88_02060 [Streptomyces cellostaticus]|uniref:Acyl-CoA carboxylase subunit epsilon n=1 Tax=Streptomyces cellostaticus TaxID=67285 RepID=A0A101NSN9_9ACTN|nr:acyl-CoA carboxylase subunit epsilon [Streptomyces cellostaticus]KUM98494.1 hypothetical protein AQI88_02060 [Streptomyces cellostaticus]GHI03113.1 hypothetical protein Scel_14340 [Streptomyces cellostaticus]